MNKVIVVFGTRPEAIKLFPVIQALRAEPGIDVRVCVTAQHRGLLDQPVDERSDKRVYDTRGIWPDQPRREAALTAAHRPGLDKHLRLTA